MSTKSLLIFPSTVSFLTNDRVYAIFLGVNLYNILRAPFSYESAFLVPKFCTKALFSSYVLAKKVLSYEKRARIMLMKLTADILESR